MPQDRAAPAALREFAIVVDAADNVAVVKTAVAAGQQLTLVDGRVVTVTGAVTPGHRFATRAIPQGDFVRQYGQPIGTSRGIGEGDPITVANMSNDVPVVRDLPADLHTAAPALTAPAGRPTWRGYRRRDGRVGTRNFVLIVPTSMCASHESQQIATLAEFTVYSREKYPNVDGVVAIPHNKGCGCSDGSNIDVMLRTLANYAAHPNVGGVIFIGLGCEKTNLTAVEKYLQHEEIDLGRPVVRFGIQEMGGTQAVIDRGLKEVAAMLPEVNAITRTEARMDELSLGVKCGGSDGFSGLRALIWSKPGLPASRDRRASFAGRWTALNAPKMDESRGEAIAAQAWSLLKRYGVIFRRLLTRETAAAPWRELARVYRRLEARGEIRSGRFVTGMSGEQFALPRAVERLREVRRTPRDGRLLTISTADPLNLVGIVTGGERIRGATRNRLVYRDGVPLAVLEGDEVRELTAIDPAIASDVSQALTRRRPLAFR